jgi:hypothetical protein
MEPTMTPEEAQRFYKQGENLITLMAQLSANTAEYTAIFESRGGKAGMGDEYGTDTEVFIGVFNNLAAMLAANNGWDQQVLNKYRNDY